ncbi:MAG: Rne/Rng family ribonuclease, partial [Desulfobulbaceae bacterium]|nr:Rne/Rng family ribonuclease [Desulfobulbaceae bacterium]
MSSEKTAKEPKKKETKVTKATTGAWWKNLSFGKKENKQNKSTSSQVDSVTPPTPTTKSKSKSTTKPSTKPKPRVKKSPDEVACKSSEKPLKNTKPKASSASSPKPSPKKKVPESQVTPDKQSVLDASPDKQVSANDNNKSAQKSGEQNSRGRSRRKKTPTHKIESTKEHLTENVQQNETDVSNVPTKSTAPKNVEIKLLINAEEPEECRIAQLENGRLESFHVAGAIRERTKNNIYKGRIVSIEANLQAAFVDIGTGRNGFLPFNDIHPEYYKEEINEESQKFIARQQWRKLKIENVIKPGQEVLVQVVKEVTGNKGANMTTYLSLPGRYLVLMPGSDSTGISRKIGGEERRQQLRELINSFNIPEGIGYIVRTASADIIHDSLREDVIILLQQWEQIRNRGQNERAPALISEEQDIVIRFLRDHFTPDIQEILVDTQKSYDEVVKFIDLLPSEQRTVKVKHHRGVRPIFNHHNVEEQIESIYQPQVSLPSGGSIVINSTEALVAIDVNSGRTSKDSNFEETIFLANSEAAAELARQLRLRDLGGLIVVDFIDMRNKRHIREVE